MEAKKRLDDFTQVGGSTYLRNWCVESVGNNEMRIMFLLSYKVIVTWHIHLIVVVVVVVLIESES